MHADNPPRAYLAESHFLPQMNCPVPGRLADFTRKTLLIL